MEIWRDLILLGSVLIGSIIVARLWKYAMQKIFIMSGKMKALTRQELEQEIQGFAGQGFHYPQEYRLDFSTSTKCHCCRKRNNTGYIWFFGDRLISICPRCGDRQALPNLIIGEQKYIQHLSRIGKCIFMLVFIIAIYFLYLNNTWDIEPYIDAFTEFINDAFGIK